MPRCWIWAASLALTAALGMRVVAADGDARRQIEQLLALGREPSAKSLRAIEHYYQSLPNADRRQPLLKYAYSIALVRQRRPHDAAMLLDELVESQPEEFAFCRARIWNALTLGERTKALTEIEQLAGHAHAHHTGEHGPVDEVGAAEFFGSVCGFFAGPWSAKVHGPDQKRLEDHLRTVFDDPSRTAFDRAKTEVGERYEQLRQAYQEHMHAELAAKTNEREKAESAAAQAGQTLADQEQTLKDKEKKRNRDTKAKLADLDDELKEIDEKRQVLLQEIAPLEAQRIALISQLVPQPLPGGSLSGNANINARRLFWGNYQRNRTIGVLLAPIVARLTTLEAKLASLNQAEQEHLLSIGVTEFKHQVDLGKLAQQERSLQKDKKRIEYAARRLKKTPLAVSPQLRAEAAHLTRFSTYVALDFDHEKMWILNQLAK